MKVCEFLLQKEGDRVWLPLEPPTVEILEGRYRVVARTQQPQTEVFVEVSYWSPEDMPPKRRTRHWNRRTNAKGIMPVLPFTTLRSGNWRVQCSSNLLEDMGDGGWQHIVELRVLAQEDDREDWQRNPVTSPGESPIRLRDRQPETSSASPPPAEPLGQGEETRRAKIEDLRSLAEQMAHLVMDTVLEVGASDPVHPPEDDETREFFTVDGGSEALPTPAPDRPSSDLTPVLDSSLASPANTTPIPSEIESSEIEASRASNTLPIVPVPIAVESPSVSVPTLPAGIQLQLHTNTIVPSPYSVFELQGHIVTANGEPLLESPLPLQARVMLKNPSNMEVRLAMTHLLATQPIDQPFYLSGHIALDWRNQLLLGEVQLQSLSLSVEDLTEDVVTIATAAFTLMPSVDALLTQVSPPAVDSNAPEEEPPPPEEVAPPRKQIRADFLEVTRRSPPRSVPDGSRSVPDALSTDALSTDALAVDINVNTTTDLTHPPRVTMPPSLKPVSPVREGTRSGPNLPTFIDPTPELPDLVADVTDVLTDAVTDVLTNAVTDVLTEAVTDVLTDAVTDGAESLTEAPTDLNVDVQGLQSLDREPSEEANLNFPAAQLTLLNLADWTDPSVAIEPNPEQPPVTPRRSIELPPVPSRSPQEGAGLNVLAPELLVDPELLNPTPLEPELLNPTPLEPELLEPEPLDPQLSAAELNAFAAEVAFSAAEQTTEETIVNFAELAAREFDAENEILLSLDPEGESNWAPSVLTTVLDSDRSLQLSPDSASIPNSASRTVVVPENAASSSPPPQPPEDSLMLWVDEPTVQTEPEALSDFGVGEFFSHEALPTANVSSPPVNSPPVSSATVSSPTVSPPDPILENFFTEAAPEVAEVPPSLSFGNEAESLDQVQVPPHLELSEVDLSDSELWDLEASAPDSSPPLRQSELFIPEHLRREIVVEDEWLEPDTRHWMSSAPSTPVVVAWPEEEPLPLPGLELPSEDLVGGEMIRVTVRLPETSSRLVVKLWLIDCQTRSLAAGPFWAYQFLPTLPQFQEAILEIPVPLGCLELQFEAVTIEAETQRESHKFTVAKAIVPPDLKEPEETLLPSDEFLDYLPSALELPENDPLS